MAAFDAGTANLECATLAGVGTVEIEPKEGDLLIFPSYLYHSVGKNLSSEDRIIISFNVDMR